MTAQTVWLAGVFATGVAAAVTKEPRLGLHRADVEPLAEDIPGRARATSTVPAVVPQHCRLLGRRHAREYRTGNLPLFPGIFLRRD
jgi:hypothetical protein